MAADKATSSEKVVELNVFHRINLVQHALPEKTNALAYSIKKSIIDKTVLSEEEIKNLGLSPMGEIPNTLIKPLEKITFKISYTLHEFDLIKKELNDQDSKSEITNLTGPLYEKFCK